MALAHLLLEF